MEMKKIFNLEALPGMSHQECICKTAGASASPATVLFQTLSLLL